MIKFRVFSLPRSGSSWASVLFTTPGAVCLHDPIEYCRTLDAYEALGADRDVGISCTGGWMLDGWDVRTPTILLDRPIWEVQSSLRKIGLPTAPPMMIDRWHCLAWPRVSLEDLMVEDRAAEVWRYLIPWGPFPRARYAELKKLKIQPSDAEIIRVQQAIELYREVA